jgi:predicted porin
MKKTLVAIAALAATGAFAQSTVVIDGIADAGVQRVNYKGNAETGVAGNGSSTSQLNVRVTQDLGAGLKANFRLESDFNAVSTNANTGLASGTNDTNGGKSINSSASTFGNGEVRAGLEGAFGRFDLGSVNYNSLDTFTTGQPFGTAIGSGFRTLYINDTQATSQVRAENAFKYVTPDFMGFKGTLYKSNKQNKPTTGTASTVTGLTPQPNGFSTSMGAYDQQGTTEAGLNYANGPIAASYSSLKNDWADIQALNSSGAAAGTTSQVVNTLGANYTYGPAKFFFLNQSQKTNTASVNKNITTVSATYTMGNYVFMAQTGSAVNKADSDKKSKLTGLGVDYNLSKTTAVYFRNETVTDDAGTVQAAVTPTTIKGTDNKWSRTAVGVRIGF